MGHLCARPNPCADMQMIYPGGSFVTLGGPPPPPPEPTPSRTYPTSASSLPTIRNALIPLSPPPRQQFPPPFLPVSSSLLPSSPSAVPPPLPTISISLILSSDPADRLLDPRSSSHRPLSSG